MAANLTFISIQARKAVRYGIYALVAIMIGRVLLGFAIDVYRRTFPPPPPPPTVGFEVLPPITFPDPNIEYPELSYTIETATGNLPEFTDQMRVYLMPQKAADLFSYDNMIERARELGFTAPPIQESSTVYIFEHPQVPAKLETDLVNETFSLSYNLAQDSSPLNERAPDEESARRIARQALSGANSFPEDLTGPVRNEFLKVEGQNLVRALSLSDAQLVQVNFYRKSFTEEEYPSVTPKRDESNVWLIVSGSRDNDKQIIAGEYRYFPVDEDRFETYPIKTAQEALDDLVGGNAYIANLGLNTSGNITIRDIYLAYYDPDRPTQFFQPVIVFEDEATGFQAFVPAVTDEYYGSSQSGEGN